MAKLTLTDITNITGAETAALAALNANWDAIVTAFENTLSRDGTAPNEMEVDLDMDGNDILNAGQIEADQLLVAGSSVVGSGFNWSGAWTLSTEYDVNDTVSNGRSSYICTEDHTSSAGTEPGVGASWETVWDLVAEGGEDGAQGPQGVPGASGSGTGDMLEATYDPQAIHGDAFDTDNHTDGTTNKVYTAAEKTKLAGIETSATADQTAAEILTLLLTVDTDDSGLNADTLDSLEGSAYAKLGVEDQTLTGGVVVTSKSLGTISSGTVTPDPGDRPLQHYTNNGAHTLGVSSNAGVVVLDITNGASAGAITTSSFTKVTGDSFTTTNGHKFRCSLSIGNGGSLLTVFALQ